MNLSTMLVRCAQQQEYTISRPKYLERKTFIQAHGDFDTLTQHRYDLDMPGTTFCPTVEDLVATDWRFFIPELHIKDMP